MSNRAICITCGEQSENHVGMFKYGSGLVENGYSIDKLVRYVFVGWDCFANSKACSIRTSL